MVGEPMSNAEPFAFRTEQHLVVLSGRRARNVDELLDHLHKVSGASIFYHTHYSYLTHNFGKPRFFNEFANWASHSLQEEGLAERLAAIDLLAMTSIRDVRTAIIATIEKYQGDGRKQRECPPGDEFHFCEAKSFEMPEGLVANGVPEFFQDVGKVSDSCLYFHFFESRLRLERPTNDFSIWLESLGEKRLARAVDRLDPYGVSLGELRDQIVKIGRRLRS